jgi:predicted nucleic acid-binding protein
VILVDSSVWIDYFRGQRSVQTDRLDELLSQQPILIGDIILTEVLQGFTSDSDFNKALHMLAALELIEIGGREVGIQAARNYRLLRARGVTVRKTIDTLIATRCIEDGIPLLFSDRDFQPFVDHLGLISAV